MAILRKIYPILLLPILAGCEEVFTPDMSYTQVLCINSLITAGEPIEIEMSKSRLYTDNASKSVVTDVDTRIYVDGELQLNSYIPNEGDNIKIVAESSSIGRAESDVTIPAAIPTPKITWTSSDAYSYTDDAGKYVYVNFKLNVELTIEDPCIENYYKLSYFTTPDVEIENDGYELHVMSIGDFKYDMEPIFSEHIGIFESIMGGDSYGFTFFTDRQFNGKSYTLHLQFDNCHFTYRKDDIPDCMVHFVINCISPSYYNWANYAWQRDNGTLSELSDYGFGDSIWGYSNVSSGAGVVAAQSQSIGTIDLTDFIKETITKQINKQ